MKASATGPNLEPAIPAHLRTERVRKSAAPKGFEPTTPSYSARFDRNVSVIPMMFIGVQGAEFSRALEEAEHSIHRHLDNPRGPRFRDRAEFIDDAGYLNVIIACYWDSRTDYRIWLSSQSADWWHNGYELDGELGFFVEAFTPGVEDSETTFSHPHPEGYATIAKNFSGTTDTHGYWGSARERIPRSQIDELEPGDGPSIAGGAPAETRGRLVVVEPHDNLFLLRSGQDWADTEGEEREFYLAKVRPVLEAGMDELSGPSAPENCYFNRYVALAKQHGDALDKTYSLSAWRSLSDLEQWCKDDSHLAIFAAGIQHYRQTGDDAKLRLYHEGTALRAVDQWYAYFNCHRRTGMLRAF